MLTTARSYGVRVVGQLHAGRRNGGGRPTICSGPGLLVTATYPGPFAQGSKGRSPAENPGIKSGGECLVESVLLLYHLQISQQDLPGSYPLVCEVAVVA